MSKFSKTVVVGVGDYVRIGAITIMLGALASAQQMPKPAPDAAKIAADAKPKEAPSVLQQFNVALQDLVARISPAVVQIQVTGYGPLEEDNQTETALLAKQSAIGSGVIVDPNGYIMTNAHVVKGAQRIRVILPMPPGEHPEAMQSGKQHVFDAKLIGIHKETDLALLKIEDTNLPILELGTHRVKQGELVVAVGSPEGLQNSATLGVVSAVGRQPDPDRPMVFIQTDAPINPGNSGGPLVDMDGYVVGINTLIFSQGGGSEGLGFAIPARVVRFVYDSLRKYGHVHRVEVKAGAQTITPALAEGLGLARSYGVIIDDVTPGGPADSAGLKIGDIVLTADDRRIDTLPAFSGALYLHPLDQVLKLTVLRGGKTVTLNIPVLEMTDSMDALISLANSENSLIPRLGILALDVNADQLHSIVGDLRIPSGVVVVARTAQIGGPATGLIAGDVIHAFNQQTITSLDALKSAADKTKPGDSVALQIERDGKMQWQSFEME